MAVRRPAAKSAPAAKPAPQPKPAVAEPKPVAAEPEPAVAEAPKKAAAKPAAKPAAAPVAAPEVAHLQDNLRLAAGKAIDQGRAAYDRMKEAGDEAAHALEASYAASSKGASELAARALDAVKTNANATFDHLKALAGAKSLSDAVSMHGQFIRTQSEAAVAQAKEFAELAKKTAMEASAPIQAQIKKPLSKS